MKIDRVYRNGLAEKDEIHNSRGASKVTGQNKYLVKRKNYFFMKGRPGELVKEFIIFVLLMREEKLSKKLG